jgi:hypothetical protein
VTSKVLNQRSFAALLVGIVMIFIIIGFLAQLTLGVCPVP